ncbi:hypothetical protein Ancab_024471 [Ancistrocladus abbreviatus]
MSVTQFAMVEELAFLVRDNLPSKHLVLSVEEALVNYLQDDSSQDGILELEPMSSYNRLLLHRLADIFGFAHESVGEGDDRHLVLERCPETSIPSILVSDILWQHDAFQAPTVPHQLLRRDDASSVLKVKVPSIPSTFEQREEAYLAARQRIFSMDDDMKEAVRQKPRHVPVVARRMIAHALGQRVTSASQVNGSNRKGFNERLDKNYDTRGKDQVGSDQLPEASPDIINCTNQNENHIEKECNDPSSGVLSHTGKESQETLDKQSLSVGLKPSGRDGLGISKANMRMENLGAAKRMFAHALGIQASRDGLTRNRQVKAVAE